MKFSTDGTARLAVDISRDDEPLRVKITTENRAADENLEDLREMQRALDRASDMMEFYLDLMKRSDPKVRGGLGLGRVAAEAEMKLVLDLQHDRVTISAELVEQAA